LTAPAQTEREKANERVIIAAIVWANDQTCSSALMELEDAVADLLEIAGEHRRLLLGGHDAGQSL
jgi:hypothetical protein